MAVFRLEFYCEACKTPFTVWWTLQQHPRSINCPICKGDRIRYEGRYEYKS